MQLEILLFYLLLLFFAFLLFCYFIYLFIYFAHDSHFFKGNELWVFLIEKAFAKYVGGYAYLDGGFSAWAWHVLTGDNVFLFELGEYLDHWKRSIYKFEPDSSKKNQRHRSVACDLCL